MTTKKDQLYTADSIQILSDFEHVRKRPSVYIGSIHPATYDVPILTGDQLEVQTLEFVPALYKCIGEITDNANDEHNQTKTKVKLIRITADPSIGKYTISDNGRGVPIDKHAVGRYTPEVVFGSLRSGRNFDDDAKQVGTIGTNGVGSSCVNAVSTDFEVTIYRDNKKYYQKFTDGATKVSTPRITPAPGHVTGTEIAFQLDPVVFKDVSLPEVLVHNKAIEIAITNPDVTVEYNGTKYRFKKGLRDIVERFTADKFFFNFSINEENIVGDIFVIPDAHDRLDEQMFTWVNSSLLFDGGKCNTQFFNAFFDKVTSHLEKDAKKLKAEVTRNDIRKGLLVLASLKIKNPSFDSQAKTRLTGPDFRRELATSVESNWKLFSKQGAQWLASVLERANERHHHQENKKAIDEHQKKRGKKIDGLLDATSKNRSICQILITEGDSAKSSIVESRDPTTTAAFALTGKINNVYGCTPAQILKMGKLTDMLSAIGLTPGKKAIRSNLNYGRIVIATDADHDGANIFALLVNLFYQNWPELFDRNYEPIVYRLVAPNVVASKGDKRVHFSNREDYENVKDKFKGWTIEYMKGLGSMTTEDWNMVLSGKTDTAIPVIDDDNMKKILTLLFSDNADMRKEWLTT